MRSCTLAFHSTFETIKSLLHLASVSTCPSLVSTLAVNLAALLAPCLHQGSPRVVSQSATRHSHLRTLCSVDPSAATGTLHHVGFGSIVAVLPARNNVSLASECLGSGQQTKPQSGTKTGLERSAIAVEKAGTGFSKRSPVQLLSP